MLQLLLNVFYDHAESRLRSLWRLLIGFALGLLILGTLSALGLYILVLLLMLTAQIPFSALQNTAQLNQDINIVFERLPLLAGIRSLIILLLVGLAFMLIARWIDRRPWRDYGFHFDAAWWRDLGFGLLLGIILMSVVFGLEYLLGWDVYSRVYRE